MQLSYSTQTIKLKQVAGCARKEKKVAKLQRSSGTLSSSAYLRSRRTEFKEAGGRPVTGNHSWFLP
jgi:hypothetical protein